MLRAESLTKRYQAHTALDNLTLISLFLYFVQPTSGTAVGLRRLSRFPVV